MANRMFPRVVVSIAGAADGQGHLAVPQVVGPTTLWDVRFPINVGGFPGWEYRTLGDALFIVVKVAAISTRCLSIIYVPVPSNGDDVADLRGLRAALSSIVAKDWAMGQTRDVIDALEADGTAIAVQVKAVWPANWRIRLSTDAVVNIDGTGTTAPPTGARIIGAAVG